MFASLSGQMALAGSFSSHFGPHLPLLFKLHKFGQLIVRKITKIVATRCHILRLKCTKFDAQVLENV